ncbi:DNA primase [Actinomycetaceae bacterium WB03_NA08]|uniref:DNA primase n=1 Tax=Scrofimicrobium canadense TaxID=2652290 RepID=A0A6N7W3M1_9ACTO|nr:DNA primase [Scrofimicrobium canadense]MSS84011.1 DNA primase [Scrofimicrobium canadense]
MEARDSLNRLIAALENHYDVARGSGVIQVDALDAAEERLRDAFFTYDDILFTQYGVELPFEMLDDDDDDDDDDVVLVDDDNED